MNKRMTLGAAALSILLPAALAGAAEVSIEGLVDADIMVRHASGSTDVTMEDGMNYGSSIDFRGTEELTNELSARFYLSMCFYVDTGEYYNDRLFDQAALSLRHKRYGEFFLGRLGSLKNPDGDMSQFKLAEGFSPMGSNLPGTGLLWMFLTDGTLDNGIGWQSPKVGGYKLSLQYSNGVKDEVGEASKDDRLVSAGLVYNNDSRIRFGGIATYHTHNTENSGTYTPEATKDVMLTVNYDFDAFRLYATYQHVWNGLGPNTMLRPQRMGFEKELSSRGFDTDSFMLGARIPVFGGKLSVMTAVSRSEFNGHADPGKRTTGWRINPGAIFRYPLSHSTMLWTGASWSHGWGMYHDVDDIAYDDPNATTFGSGVTIFF